MTVYLPIVLAGLASFPTGAGVACIHQYPYTCEDILLTETNFMLDWKMWPCKDCGPCSVAKVCQCWGRSCFELVHHPECRILLGHNEPSVAGQANIPVADEVVLHPQNVAYAREHHMEVSTPCDSQLYLDEWADATMEAVGHWPEFDYVCSHFYDFGHDVHRAVQDLKWYVESLQLWSLSHGGDGKVFLPEVGYWSENPQNIVEFVASIKPWLVTNDVLFAWYALAYVEEYTPWRSMSLVEDGQLTVVGEAYRGVIQ